MAQAHRYRSVLFCLVMCGVARVALGQPIDRGPAALKEIVAVEPADSTFGSFRIVFTTATPLPPASNALPCQAFMLDDQRVVLPPGPGGELLHIGYFEALPRGQMTELRTGLTIGMLGAGPPASTLPVDVRKLLALARPKDGEFEAPHIRRSDQSLDLVTAFADAELVFVARYIRMNSDPNDKTLWQMHFEPQSEPLRGHSSVMSKSLVFWSTSPPAWCEIGARYVVFARLQPGTQKIDAREHVAVRIWWPDHDPVLEFVKQADRLWPPSKARQDPKIRDDLAVWLRSPAPEVRLTSALAMARLGKPPAGEQAATLTSQLDTQIAREPVEAVKKALRDLQRMTPAKDKKP